VRRFDALCAGFGVVADGGSIQLTAERPQHHLSAIQRIELELSVPAARGHRVADRVHELCGEVVSRDFFLGAEIARQTGEQSAETGRPDLL
jgi:hypothetical protein